MFFLFASNVHIFVLTSSNLVHLMNALAKNCQESKGTRQWPINLYTSPMITHKIPSYVDYNYWLKRLGSQPYESTNQNPVKFLMPTNKKTLS